MVVDEERIAILITRTGLRCRTLFDHEMEEKVQEIQISDDC